MRQVALEALDGLGHVPGALLRVGEVEEHQRPVAQPVGLLEGVDRGVVLAVLIEAIAELEELARPRVLVRRRVLRRFGRVLAGDRCVLVVLLRRHLRGPAGDGERDERG